MQVIPGVYSLDCAKRSHVFFIEKESALIDTGIPGQADAILDELKFLGFAPGAVKTILLTHHDIDHTGNVKQLQEATGARVFIGKEDVPYLMKEKSRTGIKRFIQKALRAEPPRACDVLRDQSEIGAILAYYAPGHTPGHYIFQYKDVLFTGDLFKVKEGKIANMARRMNDDTSKLKASIVLLRGLSFEWACPSHGKPIKNNWALQQFITEVTKRV